ncbi:unnamed protein product [Caenorhabditis auriculariae]|uniref:Uncharacterized protein n=1 Tax=Caenorhabditis auriculariae TaxID=2777116 RepID=A0A8S1HL35_9PELO|nr:unnamed protein product [Caenorhabditis auriculariae]
MEHLSPVGFMYVGNIESRWLAKKRTLENIREVNIPLSESRRNCSFCDISKCAPLPFCYITKRNGFVLSEHCADESQLSSLVDFLWQTNPRKFCQPFTSDLSLSYCWCSENNSTETLEEVLSRTRLWRYQSLIIHAENSNSSSCQWSIFFIFFLVRPGGPGFGLKTSEKARAGSGQAGLRKKS